MCHGRVFSRCSGRKSDEELVKTASFYDYLEVQPLCNNAFLINDDKYGDITSMEDLKRLNRKVIEIGEKSGRPVCATSDAHFLFQEEQIYRDILLAKWDKPGKEESHPPVYIRTTQEMMDEFNYLPKEKAKEIVIENTRKIAASCSMSLNRWLMKANLTTPKISGADEALIHMCYDRAYSNLWESSSGIGEKSGWNLNCGLLQNTDSVFCIILPINWSSIQMTEDIWWDPVDPSVLPLWLRWQELQK